MLIVYNLYILYMLYIIYKPIFVGEKQAHAKIVIINLKYN